MRTWEQWLLLGYATVASVIAFLSAGYMSLSDDAGVESGLTPAIAQFVFLSLPALIAGWLGYVWLRQGHSRHAIGASLLSVALLIAWAVYLF